MHKIMEEHIIFFLRQTKVPFSVLFTIHFRKV